MASRILDRLHVAERSRLRTNRGIIATVLTACVVVFGAAGSKSPGASLLALLVFSPVIWWFCWWALGMFRTIANDLVRGRPPQVKVGRQWQGSSSTRQQLRQDGNADTFTDRGGILFRKRRWFIASGTPPFEIPDGRWHEISDAQLDEPRFLATWRDRSFWWYDDAFYWTTAGAYTSEDIKALLFARQRNRERELEHAHAVLAASTSPAVRKREPIPRDVRRAAYALHACLLWDMDTAVKPTTQGVEANTILRSVASPRQLYFRVGLPHGASLIDLASRSTRALGKCFPADHPVAGLNPVHLHDLHPIAGAPVWVRLSLRLVWNELNESVLGESDSDGACRDQRHLQKATADLLRQSTHSQGVLWLQLVAVVLGLDHHVFLSIIVLTVELSRL